MTGTALAPHPLATLREDRAVPAPFGPNLFASVMGTGIVGNAAVTLPLHVPGLRAFATCVWVLASLVLLVLTVSAVRRWRTMLAYVHDPVMAQFWGAPPMALMTVGNGALLFGGSLAADWALWTVGTLLGLATSVWIPFRMMTTHSIKPDSAFGGWLMPVVPPMVSAASGALIASHLDGSARSAMVFGCYALFGISMFATLVLLPQIWQRLVQHGLGAPATVPTVWIVLGPLGQSITAANLLGHVEVVPGQAAFGVLYGVIAWGFALLWLVIAVCATVRTARRGLPFALTWWSFVFPLGTVVTGTSALAAQVGSLFTPVAVLLYGVLVVAWLTVAVRTTGDVLRR